MKRYYVGHKAKCFMGEVFTAERTPTAADYPQYTRTTGPFKTRRGASWACGYGVWFSSIADAERAALADQGQAELCRAYDAHLTAELKNREPKITFTP